jgi:tRNA 2-thiouridine synthesizing protein A
MNARLDLTGLKCPLPVLRTRKALRALQVGGEIEVICTDPMSAIDIPNMVREEGAEMLEQKAQETRLVFRIRRGER